MTTWKPKILIVFLLSILGMGIPFSMLYVGRLKLAVIYFITVVFLLIISFWFWDINPSLIFSIATILGGLHAVWIIKINYDFLPRPWYSHWYGIIIIGMLIIVPILLMRIFFIEPFRISSGSMKPIFPIGSYIFTKKWGYGNYKLFNIPIYKTASTKKIARGDIIVFSHPVDSRITYVKRVIGLPNDKVEYKNKQLWINNILVKKEKQASNEEIEIYKEFISKNVSYYINLYRSPRLTHDKIIAIIPENNYYVLGDNRDNSSDSRVWGFVPKENIIGKAFLINK